MKLRGRTVSTYEEVLVLDVLVWMEEVRAQVRQLLEELRAPDLAEPPARPDAEHVVCAKVRDPCLAHLEREAAGGVGDALNGDRHLLKVVLLGERWADPLQGKHWGVRLSTRGREVAAARSRTYWPRSVRRKLADRPRELVVLELRELTQRALAVGTIQQKRRGRTCDHGKASTTPGRCSSTKSPSTRSRAARRSQSAQPFRGSQSASGRWFRTAECLAA